MKTVGYYDGVIDEIDNLKISALDRAAYFGDGVYDVAIALNKKMFTFDYHIDRFFNSAKALNINIGMTKEELKALLTDLLAKFDGDDANCYFQVSRGAARRLHNYKEDMVGKLLVMITPFKVKPSDQKAKLITVEDTRFYHCDIKTINLLVNVMAAQKAEMAGCQEVIFHRGENVTEGAHSMLMILKDGKVIMPPLNNLILPSITRKVVCEICEEHNIPLDIREMTLTEVINADEIIYGSTTRNLEAACEIDGKPAGGKDRELREKLFALFLERLANETK